MKWIEYNEPYGESPAEELVSLKKRIITPFTSELDDSNETNYKKDFWTVTLDLNQEYSVPWISTKAKQKEYPTRGKRFYNCKLSKSLGCVIFENAMTYSNWKITYESHKETYYSQKKLPGGWLKIPWRHVALDGTIRDSEWFICVASNYIPKWSKVMTTLWPGKVYDASEEKEWKHIDIYTDR